MISTGPASVINVLARWPLREFPPSRPAGSCLEHGHAYPRIAGRGLAQGPEAGQYWLDIQIQAPMRLPFPLLGASLPRMECVSRSNAAKLSSLALASGPCLKQPLGT